MGSGEGKDYLPYITTSEFNSLGTTSVIKDWIVREDTIWLTKNIFRLLIFLI